MLTETQSLGIEYRNRQDEWISLGRENRIDTYGWMGDLNQRIKEGGGRGRRERKYKKRWLKLRAILVVVWKPNTLQSSLKIHTNKINLNKIIK